MVASSAEPGAAWRGAKCRQHRKFASTTGEVAATRANAGGVLQCRGGLRERSRCAGQQHYSDARWQKVIKNSAMVASAREEVGSIFFVHRLDSQKITTKSITNRNYDRFI